MSSRHPLQPPRHYHHSSRLPHPGPPPTNKLPLPPHYSADSPPLTESESDFEEPYYHSRHPHHPHRHRHPPPYQESRANTARSRSHPRHGVQAKGKVREGEDAESTLRQQAKLIALYRLVVRGKNSELDRLRQHLARLESRHLRVRNVILKEHFRLLEAVEQHEERMTRVLREVMTPSPPLEGWERIYDEFVRGFGEAYYEDAGEKAERRGARGGGRRRRDSAPEAVSPDLLEEYYPDRGVETADEEERERQPRRELGAGKPDRQGRRIRFKHERNNSLPNGTSIAEPPTALAAAPPPKAKHQEGTTSQGSKPAGTNQADPANSEKLGSTRRELIELVQGLSSGIKALPLSNASTASAEHAPPEAEEEELLKRARDRIKELTMTAETLRALVEELSVTDPGAPPGPSSAASAAGASSSDNRPRGGEDKDKGRNGCVCM
ncbi:uncharacterized protein VTP21DRAFT_1921 [Calcarisporiella thermophila]|uniref:uncharacterized protein n=1 Tax=Calcarisporiella thermophila TaxID=911321 RepID=UPI00374430A9